MRLFIIAGLLVISLPSLGFTCPKLEPSDIFSQANEVVLVYVTGTKLEEEMAKSLIETEPAELGTEHAKIISASYRLVETFKGPENSQPKLIDILGIGTGYVGLQAGLYYLLALDEPEEGAPSNKRWVNICSVLAAHHRLGDPKFQQELAEFRGPSKPE